jgi:anti-anti-sigma factor
MINHLLLARTVQEIKAARQRKIVLDMGNVIFIDSMGVGVIVSVLKYTRFNAIGFALVTNDVVDQILGVTKLNAILQVVHNVNDAIAKAAP